MLCESVLSKVAGCRDQCEKSTEAKEQTMKRSDDMKSSRQVRVFLILALLAVIGTGLSAVAADAASDRRGLNPEQQKRMEAMKAKGADVSLTILPVRLAGQPFDRVTEVIGVMLEQQGLKNIELGKAAFTPGDKAGLKNLAEGVGQFVKKNPIATDYALYAEFNGSRQTGLNELCAMVVDKSGATVWTDRQASEDEAFKKLGRAEPMSLCILLVERLGPQLDLNEETAKAAKPGKMAAIMEERSGLPPQEERSALKGRQQAMKQAMPKGTLLVFRARIGGKEKDPGSAANLAKLINNAKLCKAFTGQAMLLKASQADPNEQKVLWNLAREFRESARKNPPAADYVLYADYVFNPQNWEQGYVHFIVCDRKGGWVIVDFQNSHHPDYRSMKPTSREACDKLLVKRLELCLR